jgi:hypothetical protein
MNNAYDINRNELLKALDLPKILPIGKAGHWQGVEVKTGHRADGPLLVLPNVWLEPWGVANRLKVECPLCGKKMRFSVLKQHADTRVCKVAAARRHKVRVVADTHCGYCEHEVTEQNKASHDNGLCVETGPAD